jgi:hypothetical protein
VWTSERQQCQAIRVLLRRVRLGRLWTLDGPTEEALDLLKRNGGPLSHGQAIMLRVAFDVWSSSGNATVGEMLGTLDNANLFAVGSLLVELSNSRPAIDNWIAERTAEQEGR